VAVVVAAADDGGDRPVMPGTPRLTARVAPGVGLAHEPSDLSPAGRSHGQWVAALFRDAARPGRGPAAVAAAVREAVAAAGRDPDRPHRRGTGV
jgi:hypothetical protein